MASPFPGMDPFLEGAKWPDVHHKLASVISELITPDVAPKYFVSVETYTIDDTSPSSELGIMYPDVAVLQTEHPDDKAPPREKCRRYHAGFRGLANDHFCKGSHSRH